MALTTKTMTDEQRKSVALEYLKAFDNKGVTSSGGSILDLFADDAQVFFPKWGLATGKQQIGQLFSDFGGGIKRPATLETDSPLYKGYKSVMQWSGLKKREFPDEIFTLNYLPRVQELRK